MDIVFGEGFPTPDGRSRLVPASIIPPAEQPDAEYPMVLTTGRQLEHWHTGAITRRAAILDALLPLQPFIVPATAGYGRPTMGRGRISSARPAP